MQALSSLQPRQQLLFYAVAATCVCTKSCCSSLLHLRLLCLDCCVCGCFVCDCWVCDCWVCDCHYDAVVAELLLITVESGHSTGKLAVLCGLQNQIHDILGSASRVLGSTYANLQHGSKTLPQNSTYPGFALLARSIMICLLQSICSLSLVCLPNLCTFTTCCMY